MMNNERGQAAIGAIFFILILFLVSAAVVDIYQLQEARNWAYRAAEAAALAGTAEGRDLSAVYSAGQPRVAPTEGRDEAEQVLLETLNRRGVSGASYQIEVSEWGGDTFTGFPPVSRADLWGASDWHAGEPSVGVYLEVPVQTHILGLAFSQNPVPVHVFAAAGIAELQ